MKKLSEMCNQEPILEFEGYVIRPFDEWTLWFENPLGEGTQIRKADFLVLLDRFFNKSF